MGKTRGTEISSRFFLPFEGIDTSRQKIFLKDFVSRKLMARRNELKEHLLESIEAQPTFLTVAG